MHPNLAYRKASLQRNIDYMHQRSFGALSLNADPSPLISHIPFQLSADGAFLEAHLVRSNPILRLLDEPRAAVIAVSGADGYISPDWYQLDNQVPTWNYIAVHARGQLRRLEQARLRDILQNLSANMEHRLLPKKPWTLEKLDADVFAKLEKQIVPIAMDISEITGTWKLGQTKPEEARRAAATEVARNAVGAETQELSVLMLES